MKTLGLVLAVIFLLLGSLVGVLGTNKSMDTASDIDKVLKGAPAAVKSMAPSTSRLRAGGVVGILAAMASLGLIVLTFTKKNLVPKVAIAVVVLSALAIIIYPKVPTGPTDGMAPRTQAIVAAVMALIGAGGAFLNFKKSDEAGHGAAVRSAA